MRITKRSLSTGPGPKDWFTGDAYVDPVATPGDGARMSASSVHFTRRARARPDTPTPTARRSSSPKASDAASAAVERLGLEYLDLYLIHQPFGDVYGAWRDMQALYREGRIRAIGVSNFPPDRVMDLMIHNEVPPAVDQIETHPFNQHIDTQQFLRENGVQQEAWAPFAEGRREIFHNELLDSLATKCQKSVAQIILRWLTQRGIVAIPKSVRKERIVQNFDVFDVELGPQDMDAIASLDLKSSSFFDHRDPAVVKRLSEARRDT